MSTEVHVIGAGIGGVALAIALAQRGFAVRVLEQTPALAEVGAGLQISANGMAVLRGLGVAETTGATAVRSTGTDIRDMARGRLVTHVPPPAAGPTFYMHRADLLGCLVARAEALKVVFELSTRVTGYQAGAEGCHVTLADGNTRHAAVVIAADGGQSQARHHINGAASPMFSGQVAWRATVPGPGHADTGVGTLTMGSGRHVVSYPLRGGRLMNIVAVEERRDWTREGWRLQGDPQEMRTRFAGFGGAVEDLLAQVETTHLWALYLHPVARRWYKGGLGLLGDAAHPTLPFMAQGACLALEDAWVLARCLEVGGAPGLKRYQESRHARASRVVAAAAGNARRFHLKAPLRWVAQGVLKLAGARLGAQMDWIYAHDVTR